MGIEIFAAVLTIAFCWICNKFKEDATEPEAIDYAPLWKKLKPELDKHYKYPFLHSKYGNAVVRDNSPITHYDTEWVHFRARSIAYFSIYLNPEQMQTLAANVRVATKSDQVIMNNYIDALAILNGVPSDVWERGWRSKLVHFDAMGKDTRSLAEIFGTAI